MDSGLYAAYTGLLSRTQALETAANNLANANTNGFRAQKDFFRGMMAAVQTESSDSTVEGAVNAYGVLGGNVLDLSQGQINSTGNPLDLALNGPGFFQVKTAHGMDLTRDGAFLRSESGMLVTQHGEPVLSTQGKPIVVPQGNIHIGPDGEVSVSMPDGSSAIAGQMGVVNYAAGDLTAAGANRFQARKGAIAIGGAGSVQSGALEGANQDAVHGTMQLLLVQRQAEMMQKALSVFTNDFDKIAAEEIGRV